MLAHTDNQIYVLGHIRVIVQNEELTWTRRKTQALIARLAVHPDGQSRDVLAAFLWPESSNRNARASLRRVLTEINQSPLQAHIDIERQYVRLIPDALWIDVREFEQSCRAVQFAEKRAVLQLYRGPFLEGFSLKNSVEFDNWQATMAQRYHAMAQQALLNLARQAQQQGNREIALQAWHRLYEMDALHDDAIIGLMQLYNEMGLTHAADTLYDSYTQNLEQELGVLPSDEVRAQYQRLRGSQAGDTVFHYLPPLPEMVIGRDQFLNTVTTRLKKPDTRLVLQGWPGIGKTTLTATLAHQRVLQEQYSDGVLWASIGETPDLMMILREWSRHPAITIAPDSTLEQAQQQVRTQLREASVLIILDDVWQIEHARSLQIAGERGSVLITTRFNDVAYGLMVTPDNLLKVPVLTQAQSMTLLEQLAPAVVAAHRAACETLAQDLEGLPLALQVVGRLLHEESAMGWSVRDLLNDLRDTSRLLEAEAPRDRVHIASQTTPTIAAILERSVRHLSDSLQERFALLGVFAPKPAHFTLDAIAAVWDDASSREDVRQLVRRGLLEPAGNRTFQMHALVAMLARSMVKGSLDD